MSLYHEAAAILSTTGEGGSLKSRIYGKKDLKSPPAQLYALVFETCKWSFVLKEVIEAAELLKDERKVSSLAPTMFLES
jgi:putative methyltransferase